MWLLVASVVGVPSVVSILALGDFHYPLMPTYVPLCYLEGLDGIKFEWLVRRGPYQY